MLLSSLYNKRCQNRNAFVLNAIIKITVSYFDADKIKYSEPGKKDRLKLGKPVQNPTVRWLFQCMEGINIVYLQSDKATKALITGLTPLRKNIIRLFGPTACRLYGLIIENAAEGL